MKTVNVIFVRHAESEENVKVQYFCDIINGLKEFKLPSFYQVYQVARLLEFDLDANISVQGKRQLADMKKILLDDNFLTKNKVTLCAYSPLQRAKETCFSIFPTEFHEHCIELQALKEVTPIEHLSYYLLNKRIQKFEKWLTTIENETVIVVGHSQYFNRLLKMKTLMRNCDLWSASATFKVRNSETAREDNPITWGEPKLLHRTYLANPHPLGTLLSWRKKESNDGLEELSNTHANDDDVVVDDDLDENSESHEATCRICQAKQSENPREKMFKPCLCKGSLSFVHYSCLNHWRSTSTDAYFRCNICNYKYNIQRTFIAKILVHPQFIFWLSLFLVGFSIFLVGIVLFYGGKMVFGDEFNLASYIYPILGFQTFGKPCNFRKRNHLQFNELINIIYDEFKNRKNYLDFTMELRVFLDSPLFASFLRCQRFFSTFIDICILGVGFVGFSGFFGNILMTLMKMRNFGLNWQRQGFLLMVWMISLGNEAFSRLAFLVGCLVTIHEVYQVLTKNVRVFGDWLGEVILEPN